MFLDDPAWMNWAIRDERYGAVIGMYDDAPEWARKIYEEHEEMRKAGFK